MNFSVHKMKPLSIFDRWIILSLCLSYCLSCSTPDPKKTNQDQVTDQTWVDQKQMQDISPLDDQKIVMDQQVQITLDQMSAQDQQISDLAFFDPNQTDLWLGDTQESPMILSENQLLDGNLWLKVNQLITPKTVEEARTLGCALRGEYQGSGISNIESLAGIGFNFLVRGNLNTPTPLNMGLRLGPLPTNQPIDHLSSINTAFGEFRWDDQHIPYFTDGALSWMNQNLENQWIDTPQGEISLPIRLASAPAFDMKLSKASLSVRLFDLIKSNGDVTKAKGKGVVMGYVYRSDLIAMVDQIKVQCLSDMPPALCALFGSEIAKESEYLADVASTFLGGWELAVVNGEFTECLRADQVVMDMGMGDVGMMEQVKCDMISFCLGVEMQAISVE